MASDKDFPKRLRWAIKTAHITQRVFASKCDFSQGLVQGMLSGKNTPPPEKIDRMIQVLLLAGDDAELFREAAMAAHSHAGLVTEFRQRGQEIERLRSQVEFYERIISTPDPVADAEVRAESERLGLAELVDEVVKVKRANRKLSIRAWPKRPAD